MGHRGTLLCLLVVALAAGVVMDGVNGESSFVRRRLAGQEPSSTGGGDALIPSTKCPFPCLPSFSCCQYPKIGVFPGVFRCFPTSFDLLNCGSCGNVCPPGSICCSGKCSNLVNDRNNCGSCSKKCPAKGVCAFGMCSYTG